MQTVSSPGRLLLIAAGVGLLIWNVVATANFSARLERIEAGVVKVPGVGGTSSDQGLVSTEGDWQGQQTGATAGAARDRNVPDDIADPVAYLDDLKRSQGQIAPEQRARELDTRLSQEPSNPAQEASAQEWLQQAASNTKADNLARPADVATQCRGQRCMTSGTFANQADAEMWATRYLLAAGGKPYANSRAVILPGRDGSSVSLHLYLF